MSRSPVTDALHHKVAIDGAEPAVTPIFQNSAFSASSPHFYTRKSNPNSVELEQVVATLEECRHGVATTTGMMALTLACSLAPGGCPVVVNKHTYGCSFKLFARLAKRRGWELHVLDLSRATEIERIPAACGLVLFETPTNPFLYSIDIAAVSAVAKRRNPSALVVVDNTWATPLFQHPLEHGADVSVYSATKFFSGHSDVMGGLVMTERDDLHQALLEERFYTGAILAPHDAWLLRRSMQTFALRMERHRVVTLDMAAWLTEQTAVGHVFVPRVDGRQLLGYGGIVFFELAPELSGRYSALNAALELFDDGTAMACVTSMIAQPYTGSHASMDDAEKAAMGLNRDLVRLCFGLEDVADLKADLQRAFNIVGSEPKAKR